MDSQQVKQILLLHRPGLDREANPELEVALEQAKCDPDLARWFEQHCAVQTVIRSKFKEIPLPSGLREKILAENKVRRLPFWRRPVFLAAAATIALLILAGSLSFGPREEGNFSAYQDRMVRTALRDYRMNMVTNDLSQIREYLARHQAHGDYVLAKGLEKLPGQGCAILNWHGQRVSLICFDSSKADLFLFIINRSALPDGPSSTQPRFKKVNKLMTATWSLGDKTYLLAGPDDEPFLKKHFQMTNP
jgi:hypothetical protein